MHYTRPPANCFAQYYLLQNSEIYNLCDEYGVKFIKLGRLRWVGYVMRMEEGEPAKKSPFYLLSQEDVKTEEEVGRSLGGATS
jgi:hypothetical protein